MTVVLNGQKENTLCPSFGRDGVLSGTLFIDSPETVTSVKIKVRIARLTYETFALRWS
jgi:hypothetical protein